MEKIKQKKKKLYREYQGLVFVISNRGARKGPIEEIHEHKL